MSERSIKPPRPTPAWAVVNHLGHIWVWTVSHTRTDAIRKADEAVPQTGWSGLKAGGCRAIKIRIEVRS